MSNPQEFRPGDFLVFQIESGYAMMRVLRIDNEGAETVWHVAAYSDLFMDVDQAEAAIASQHSLKKSIEHVALTERAFESTQVAKLSSAPLENEDLNGLRTWQNAETRPVYDRSIRLLMGLR